MKEAKKFVKAIIVPFNSLALVIAFFMVLIKLLIMFWNWLGVIM